MIELVDVRPRLLKTVLPFVLASGIGVLSVVGSRHLGSSGNEPMVRASSPRASHSRTWLIVQSHLMSPGSFISHGTPEHHAVQLRARFGADGKVSQIAPLSESLPEELVPQMTDDARRIKFIPPTEDGRPLAATVDVTYELNALCACGNDMLDDGRCQGGHLFYPTDLNFRIVSIEGAKESEGWRVVYE
jgi:hypothetical protein